MTRPRPGAWELLPARAKELFGIELARHQLEAFERYLQVLDRWSARMNLVGAATRGQLIDRHLLDSLAPVRWIQSAKVTVDVGSGAGFPGIPLAAISPSTRFHLIESRIKRASFLRHVIRTLGLRNVEVWDVPAAAWKRDDVVDVVVSRAVAAPDLETFARRVLENGGRLLLMRKAPKAPTDIAGFERADSLSYRLPAGELHEVVAFERVG